MSVQRVDLSGTPCRIPRHLQILLDESAEDLTDWQGACDPGSFVPADYVLVFDALCEMRTWMPRGERPVFLEWGSGLGLVTLMASALGWRASGIEVQPGLVRESLRLARAFDLEATFLEGSFFPGDPATVPKLAERTAKADVIYVYPWPDQEIEIFDLFDRLAKPGAHLLAYFGIEDIRAFRKG
jgi:hypothetical protein